MDFLDSAGHIFTLETYADSTGYELKQNKYIFWMDNPVADFDLSINTYYLKQITPYFNKDSIDIYKIRKIKVELNSDRFSLIKYSDVKSLTLDLNTIDNLKEITFNRDEFIIDDQSGTEFDTLDMVAPFFVLARSADEGTFTTNALISVEYGTDADLKTFYSVITLGGTFVGEDEKFSININNLGFTIPKGIVNAIYQGELNLDNYQGNYNNFDFSLYNSKLREYLIYNKNLKNNKGNYDSIKSHLDWFGWGADLILTKLLRTDNQFMSQYLDRDYIANADNNVLINRFIHTALINVRLAKNKILYKYYNKFQTVQTDNQDWNGSEFVGEGTVKTFDLFEKYFLSDVEKVASNTDYQNPYLYAEPFYRYSINTILLKLAFLKYYYKKYFLPVHVDTLGVDVNERCFIPDTKLYTVSKSGFTTPMLLNSDNNYVLIGNNPESKTQETIFLSKSTCYSSDYFISFQGYTEHENLELITNSKTENLFEVREMHAKIPLKFYKDVDEYFNLQSELGPDSETVEDNDYIYNINIILSKYSKDLNRYTSVYSVSRTFTKTLVGNSENFILLPNLNGTNHDTTWYDNDENLYRLDVCSNGSWFSKEFLIEFPPVDFNLGYLEYTYQTETETSQGVSPFSSSLGESFMREPGLVTLDSIKFSKETRKTNWFDGFYIDSTTGRVKTDFINLYKDNYNIPSRDTNPELYNIILYFDYQINPEVFTDADKYNSTLEAFKKTINNIIDNYDFSDYFDIYIMYQPNELESKYKKEEISKNIYKSYIVLISKQTSSDSCYDNINSVIETLKTSTQTETKFVTKLYRFLINRYKVVPYPDNVVDTSKILTCSVSSVYEINVPFNLDLGLKWNFVPYSLIDQQAFNVTSKADIALVSIPRFQDRTPSGYYNIYLNYSLNGYDTVSIKAPYKILFK